MQYLMFSVYDRAAQAFGRPIFALSENATIRDFRDEINRQAQDNTMNRHPGDFELVYLGTFDDQGGGFDISAGPRIAALGREMKQHDTPQPVNQPTLRSA